MPLAEVNGINVYYEIHGKGEPLLIIPGLSMDLTALSGVTKGLAQRYRVIAFDNRGAGRTDKPRSPYSIEMMADDTAGLLNVLGIGRANIIGLSMGGRIAIALTLKHPANVKSLILVSSGFKVPNTLRRRLYLGLLDIPRRAAALGKTYPQPNYAYVNQRRASQGYDATERLHEIGVPTLILQGRRDRLAPYKLAEEMHTAIQGSKIVSFKGGHMFLFWRQGEFIQAVEQFLESGTSKSSQAISQ